VDALLGGSSEVTLGPEDIAFRDEWRAWLDANIEVATDEPEWHRRLVAGRWAVPSWPEKWGGRAATLVQQVLLDEEAGRVGAPVPRNSIALFNIGPMLMGNATERQLERYLPPMVTADEIWCQGFSEPDAGSDLAALTTKAVDQGDHWLVSGRKIWTTFAAEADLCLALVRTDPDAPKHDGIAALVVPMRHPGVEVRPLRDLTGEVGFSEILFTDVPVPKEDVVGAVNGGWRVAMSTLTFERLGTMRLGSQLGSRLGALIDLARDLGRDREPWVRMRIAALAVEVGLMRLLAADALRAIQRGDDPGATVPLGKLQWSELMQTLAETALAVQGPEAQLARGSAHEVPGDWQYHALYARMTTIGAGTTQVQRNIIAQRQLGLPRDDHPGRTGQYPRDRALDAERDALRTTVRRLLADRAPTEWVRTVTATPTEQSWGDLRPDAVADHPTTPSVRSMWGELAALGVTGLLVPEEYGGLGLGHADLGVVVEELGRAVHPGPFLSSAVGAVSAVLAAGSDEDRRELLPTLASGDRIGTVAVLEPDRRWDWREPSTTARAEDGTWVVDGTKSSVADADAADLIIVSARAGDDIALIVVDRDAPGVTVTPLVTVDATKPVAEVGFEGAHGRRLGTQDSTAALAITIDRLVAASIAETVGAAAKALELATAYAKVRVQFDRPIGAFQSVQHLLAEMLRHVELARSGAHAALRAADRGDDAAAHAATLAAKAYASDALHRACADAIQVLGGIGFTWEHDAHLYYRRSLWLQQLHGGTPEQLSAYAAVVLGPPA